MKKSVKRAKRKAPAKKRRRVVRYRQAHVAHIEAYRLYLDDLRALMQWETDGGYVPPYVDRRVLVTFGGDEASEGEGVPDEDAEEGEATEEDEDAEEGGAPGGDEETGSALELPPQPTYNVFSSIWAPSPRQPLNDTRYDSLAEFMDVCSRRAINPRNEDWRRHWFEGECNPDRTNYKIEQYLGPGCRNGKDVQRIVNEGWPFGVEKLQSLMSAVHLERPPVDHRRRLVHTDIGDSVDMSAIYAGHHSTAWTRARRQRMFAPQQVTIIGDMSTAWFYDWEVQFWRGAAVVVLADVLEGAGYVTRIVHGHGGHEWDTLKPISCRITVKDHGEPLNLSSMAAVILPGFTRAMDKAWYCASTERTLICGEQTRGKVGSVTLDDGDYVIGHGVSSFNTAKRRLEEIITQIEEKVQ